MHQGDLVLYVVTVTNVHRTVAAFAPEVLVPMTVAARYDTTTVMWNSIDQTCSPPRACRASR